VSGIQASLDLVNLGYKVYMVESGPSIGGVMGMLDKTFPTNECSMCILSPKMVEIASNQNIDVITLAEVERISGDAGYFIATLRIRPRYVDVEKCTGCGECTASCPVKVPDPYNANLSITRNIRVPFPQAVPGAAFIDPTTCRYFTRGKCRNCIKVCQAKAINFADREKSLKLEVGAVILAPGFAPFDPRRKPEYGYGIYPNVITSLEFERILGANGPTSGRMVRPSDGREVKKLAFVQCVGSRDSTVGREYCSGVCCMYATKQALIAREHLPTVESTIFYIDLRAHGKDFERYYQKASKSHGVRYVRGLVSGIKERQRTKNLLLRYMDDEGRPQEDEYDLVVLSIGLEPPRLIHGDLGIEFNRHGFIMSETYENFQTLREGVMVCGAGEEPRDIPECVTQASAAAGRASQLLSEERGSKLVNLEYPPEREVSDEPPRVGVIVCRCGSNIGGFVDVPEVVEYAKCLNDVVCAEERMYACSQDAQEWIRQLVKEKGLNRLVVASCTPRTHQPLFQETLKSAGLNKYLCEMANIREHCSWVHMHEPELATRKAKYLVKMAVEKARLLRPLKEGESEVIPRALVLGGGVAGMNVALSLARSGFPVYLVEKEEQLGGLARNILFSQRGGNVQAYLADLVRQVEEEELISIFKGSRAVEIGGFVGNFRTLILDGEGRERLLEHGAIIVATGGAEYQPDGYGYHQDPRVITQWELERHLHSGFDEFPGGGRNYPAAPGRVAMIQCVGSRDEERPYCSRVCCTEAMKNALAMKEKFPSVRIFVLYRDIRTYGFREELYREAREKGVTFVRFSDEEKPRVRIEGDLLQVTVKDASLGGEKLMLDVDLVVLSTGVLPNPDNQALAPMLKVPLNADGFFLEAHVKLRPVDFSTDGIFVCGLAHAPKSIEESIAQAVAAAARAEAILSREKIITEGIIASIDEGTCSGCQACIRLCPFEAIYFDEEKGVAAVNSSLCKGCGTCTAACTSGANRIEGFRFDQIIRQIEAVGTAWRD
jgi:heterodisulfide reductase subunit A